MQWIFIHRGLAAALLHEATRAGDDPALVARASFIMKQPSDAEVHDDHMHIRFYCAPADRSLGCVDKGPVAVVEEDVEVHGRAVRAAAG